MKVCESVCVCSIYIVTVQHSEEFWVCDELDGRWLEEMADLLMIDRGGGACRYTAGELLSMVCLSSSLKEALSEVLHVQLINIIVHTVRKSTASEKRTSFLSENPQRSMNTLRNSRLFWGSVWGGSAPDGGASGSVSVLLLRSSLGFPQSSSVAMVLWMFWYLQREFIKSVNSSTYNVLHKQMLTFMSFLCGRQMSA